METRMYSEVCIIGGGAVGSSIAYFLYRSGLERIPVYYGSEDSVKAVSEQGGVLLHDKQRKVSLVVPVEPRYYINPLDKCVFVFNTVKAYDVDKTLELMKKITFPHSVVIMTQNGFGSLELAEETLSGVLKVAGGVVYFGAERVNRAEVVYHGGDTVLTGCRKEPCIELLELSRILRLGGLEFRVVDDIDYYRWLKLALNAVVNPITALARFKNRIVLEKEGMELAEMILEEVCKAAKKHGYTLDMKRLLSYVERSVKAVSENISSMAQDVLMGRTTEIDYINGFIWKTLGEEAKVNRSITLLIKLLEKSANMK
ncbi:MAG: 2-dehydropantoate 2-reductase [Desulfurococcaceae archaeon]